MWDKNIDKFLTSCSARYELSGRALHNTWALPEGASQSDYEETLSKMGYFKLLPPGAGEDAAKKYTKVAHISGKEVKLQECHTMKDWDIKDNMNFNKAMLKDGLDMICLAELFAQSGLPLEAPVNLKEVPQAAETPNKDKPEALGNDKVALGLPAGDGSAF